MNSLFEFRRPIIVILGTMMSPPELKATAVSMNTLGWRVVPPPLTMTLIANAWAVGLIAGHTPPTPLQNDPLGKVLVPILIELFPPIPEQLDLDIFIRSPIGPTRLMAQTGVSTEHTLLVLQPWVATILLTGERSAEPLRRPPHRAPSIPQVTLTVLRLDPVRLFILQRFPRCAHLTLPPPTRSLIRVSRARLTLVIIRFPPMPLFILMRTSSTWFIARRVTPPPMNGRTADAHAVLRGIPRIKIRVMAIDGVILRVARPVALPLPPL